MQVLLLIPLLGLLFPKNKTIAWIEIIAMSLFYGGYNGTTDITNYIWQYENNWMTDMSLQKLYSCMSIFFHHTGMSFEWYHLMITFVSLVLILCISSKLTDQTAYVMSMISVFVYIENGWQLKTMMATCIIVIALYWFYTRIYYCAINKNKNRDIIVFLFMIFIAAQFHFLSLFFILFLFIPYVKGHLTRVIVIDVCAFVVVGVLLYRVSNYIPMIRNYLSPISPSSFVVTGLWQILGYCILFFNRNSIYNVEDDKYRLFVKDGTLILMLLIPFYYYANVATRIYRIWIIFMIIYATKLVRRYLTFNMRRVFFSMYIILSSFFWFYILFVLQGREPIVNDLINNNRFF